MRRPSSSRGSSDVSIRSAMSLWRLEHDPFPWNEIMLSVRRAVAFSATNRCTLRRKILHMSKTTTELILGDLQNDFLHPDGAYGRAGQSDPSIAALPARLAPLVRLARERGVLIVANMLSLSSRRR